MSAVTGYFSNNNDIVYAGPINLGGNAAGTNYANIWRTADGGDHWTPLIYADVNVSDTIHGQPHDWWFRVDAFTQAGQGRRNSAVSSIDVARGSSAALFSDGIIFVSGRGGIWKSDNGGDSWKPAVNNMQSTSNHGVAVNPGDPDQIALANTDYVFLETSAGFNGSNMSRDKPEGVKARAFDVIFDEVTNDVILSVGNRDSNDSGEGEVYVKSASTLDVSSGSGWTDTNLGAATASNDGRVRAVSYGYHDGTAVTTQTILAAVEGEGVFRYHNVNWLKSIGLTIGSTDRSNFVWPDSRNSGTVYLVDLSTGLYRSSDGGRIREDIWQGMSFRNNDFFKTGYITADDNNPTTLYLSVQGELDSYIGTAFKVYRMTGANEGT